ncbi:MAG: hypothetical protein V2J51_05935 [Erythrobacter sp.]|jgi:glutathione synthase/RimK-type ligase-like ATP-grasp enzyme|nr:hypothetical protein [Erythrobacter sp.]
MLAGDRGLRDMAANFGTKQSRPRMIAIHVKTGAFAEGWAQYCEKHGVPFRRVDCFASDIVSQLQGCRALLWHWQHHDYRAALFARQLIASLESKGMLVFPGTSTCWHYDDKVGQKYLLEAVGAPLVRSHVFYEAASAMRWLDSAEFPIVWKLRGGAGSQNVRLVQSRQEAVSIVRKSFGRGWQAVRTHALQERVREFRDNPGLITFTNIGRGVVRAVIPHEKDRNRERDRNYVYFQDFVPNNDFDVRTIVIGDRAFGIKRMVRPGDFRASGSGAIIHRPDAIPEECIRISFDVTESIGSQCCAFDFVRSGKEWKIIEISYAFALPGYADCPGYWDRQLSWHAGAFHPERFMIEDVLAHIGQDRTG